MVYHLSFKKNDVLLAIQSQVLFLETSMYVAEVRSVHFSFYHTEYLKMYTQDQGFIVKDIFTCSWVWGGLLLGRGEHSGSSGVWHHHLD